MHINLFLDSKQHFVFVVFTLYIVQYVKYFSSSQVNCVQFCFSYQISSNSAMDHLESIVVPCVFLLTEANPGKGAGANRGQQ